MWLAAPARATLYLSDDWGLRFDDRLLTGQGEAEDIGPFDAAGSWFSPRRMF